MYRKHRFAKTRNKIKKILLGLIAIGSLVFFVGLGVLGWLKITATNTFVSLLAPIDTETNIDKSSFFPVGVDFTKKEITEDPLINNYVQKHFSINTKNSRQNRLTDRFFAELSTWNIFQQLASPQSRVLVIYPGERKEEIVKNFSQILRWNTTKQTEFLEAITTSAPALTEGKFSPGKYITDRNVNPQDLAESINQQFATKILSRYNADIEAKVPLEIALIIASLIEREAYDFTDMRLISGVIWNRLFIDMPLQLDASLQYVRGSQTNEIKWWPKVNPSDKYLNSPFNTYKNVGLPPTPIANPSIEAVVAALNPKVTDCFYYLHSAKGEFYCSPTYDGHLQNIRDVYR